MIPGYATLEGTAEYFRKRRIRREARRDTPWFQTSCLVHGTYRGRASTEDSALYREALSFSLRRGINWLDTALVYRDQASERDIRRVLRRLILEEGILDRKQLVIASKAGFLPADADAGLDGETYLQRLLFGPGVIGPDDVTDLRINGQRTLHCLHPDFLEFCLEQSRQNLGLACIDIFYLQNPELALPALGVEEFYARLHEAFVRLESFVADGRIRHYGLASWLAFQLPQGHPAAVSLERCFVEARSAAAGRAPAFHFLQIPLNGRLRETAENESQIIKNRPYTTLAAAAELGVQVTASVPLDPGGSDETIPATVRLREIVSTPGLLAATVGMRQRVHVSENLDLLDPD